MIWLKVTCPKCGNIEKYSSACAECDDQLLWTDSVLRRDGVQCSNGHRFTKIDCKACGQSVPIIGKLVKFDDSDSPMLARILNRIGGLISGSSPW